MSLNTSDVSQSAAARCLLGWQTISGLLSPLMNTFDAEGVWDEAECWGTGKSGVEIMPLNLFCVLDNKMKEK